MVGVIVGVEQTDSTRGVLVAGDIALLFQHFQQLEDTVAGANAQVVANLFQCGRFTLSPHEGADELVGVVLALCEVGFHR